MTRFTLPALILLILTAAACRTGDEPGPNSFVLHDAVIYTMDEEAPVVESMAVINGRVAALGPAAELFAAHPDLDRRSAKGKTVVPGLIDAHAHLMDLGIEQMEVDLRGTRSVGEAAARVSTYRAEHPEQDWIQGRGWNQVLWPDNRFPTRHDLDERFPDTPVWLVRVDGHAGWANTAAMEAAGAETIMNAEDPEGGAILRDSSGSPTGIFVDEAMQLIQDALPERDDDWYDQALELALRKTAAVGLTGVHDAGVTIDMIERYKRFIDEDRFPLRVYAMVGWDAPAAVDEYCNNHLIDYGGRLTVRSVKMYVDGALGSRGAAMIEPYSDDPDNHGLIKMDADSLADATQRALECGYQVNSHAIGDMGNRIVLDAYEEVGISPRGRHRNEHAQVVALDDFARFRQLGVIASMQPTHATSDLNMAEDRVGPHRIKGAYAWRTFLDQGTPLAFGSDFAVERPNPLLGVFAAVARQTETLFPEGGWYPEERVSRNEALHGFTMGAAYAGFQENELGSLSPGKNADFVVLSKDIMRVPAPQILETVVVATYLGGKPIHGEL